MTLVFGSAYAHYYEPTSIKKEAVLSLSRIAYQDEQNNTRYAVTAVINPQFAQVVVTTFATETEAITYIETDPDGFLV